MLSNKTISNSGFLTRIFHSVRKYSTDTKAEIVIPKRIPRGPTDILSALDSTVGRDPTAAHYKYHDDPYLMPMSNLGKRTFAMSQEAGRKAAHWIVQQHPELFKHREMDPIIKPFVAKTFYDENSTVTEEDLKNTIENRLVDDAQLVYKLLKNKGIEISNQTSQDLLELLCFYNHEQPISEELIEERWFKQGNKGREKARKTWKDGMLAEEIFISIDKPNEEVYSALIQGMVKYGQINRALELFKDANEQNKIVSLETFNALLSVGNMVKDSYELRWTYITDLLGLMVEHNIKPDCNTLNAVLQTMSSMGHGKLLKENVYKVLAEFKALGVEPSLASWYYILNIHCQERGPRNFVLHSIMKELEGKELQIKNVQDTYFFVTAMDVCHYHLQDPILAEKVHNLLLHKQNYNLIGDSYKESIYYRHYLSLRSKSEPLGDFMENCYYRLVPHIYVPEPSVMLEILRSVEVSGLIEYLPKLFSDMIIFDHLNRANLLSLTLEIMITNEPTTDDLKEKFSNIGWEIFKKFEKDLEYRGREFLYNGNMMGQILTVLLGNKDIVKAGTIMNTLSKNQNKTEGVPSLKALSLFVDSCIENNQPKDAINCLEYANDMGHDISSLAINLQKNMSLNDSHLSQLSKLVSLEAVSTESLKS